MKRAVSLISRGKAKQYRPIIVPTMCYVDQCMNHNMKTHATHANEDQNDSGIGNPNIHHVFIVFIIIKNKLAQKFTNNIPLDSSHITHHRSITILI